jgi:putative oxidoreductase
MKTQNRTFLNITTFFFALLFTYAAINKIITFDTFELDLMKSPITGPIAKPLSYILPIVELLVAIFLLLPRKNILGFYLTLLLMVVFTFYVAYLLLFAPELPCHCGGLLRQMTWTQHLIFNSSLTVLSAIALKKVRNQNSNVNQNNQIPLKML